MIAYAIEGTEKLVAKGHDTEKRTATAPALPAVVYKVKAVLDPVLAEAIGRLAPLARQVVKYHLGWVDEHGNEQDKSSGKFIRPALVVLSTEACYADWEIALPGAAAIELVHNFSLLHDDVIDVDRTRRHRSTAWAQFGVGAAVIAGDALMALAPRLLIEAGHPQAAYVLLEATSQMIDGQCFDMDFEHRNEVSFGECLTMAAGKTGALLGCAASLGAVMAGAPDATVEGLRRYGEQVGLAFQAVDDLLGIWGDPARTGKPVYSDLRQGKKTIPLVAALSSGCPEVEELEHILNKQREGDGRDSAPASLEGLEEGHLSEDPVLSTTNLGPKVERDFAHDGSFFDERGELEKGSPGSLSDEELARAAQLIEKCGGREVAAELALSCMDLSVGELDRLQIAPHVREQLIDMATFVVNREL
ncbi:MAG: polyprenyl synthetase family protein [Actinobacteria bacterium]|jgi:geranylgeranyl diphosphate synthase type I|nr:polyprenyl synthetase family protein [Actinomycetota bacterium]MCL6095413.1 polyprenyl synthetase family protein [Actinomycetota bacterium]